jgi:large subunit ribosomal protein L25
VSVGVEPVGDPVGVKTDGGIFELQLREVEVECLPGDIPEHLKVEVWNLHIGDHVTVADLIYDREKVKVLADESQIVAGVLAPRMIEEVAPAAVAPEGEEAAAAEPEVIKKGKAEEEE